MLQPQSLARIDLAPAPKAALPLIFPPTKLFPNSYVSSFVHLDAPNAASRPFENILSQVKIHSAPKISKGQKAKRKWIEKEQADSV
jgi:hypothetical protein